MKRALVTLLLALLACGDEAIDPAPYSAGGAGAAPTTAGAGGGSAPAVKRTVEQRNPFGNVAASDNLLWDGDFEWRSTFASQYGWLASPSPQFTQLMPPPLEMGARCRSGVKCARVDPGWVIVGLGVASKLGGLGISVWTKPEEASCTTTATVMFLSQANDEVSLMVAPETPTPAADGWCHYFLSTPERKTASYLYLTNTGPSPLLVDDAVVQPALAGEMLLSGSAGEVVPEAIAAPLRARLWEATRPRTFPPSDEQIRFEQRMRSRRWIRR